MLYQSRIVWNAATRISISSQGSTRLISVLIHRTIAPFSGSAQFTPCVVSTKGCLDLDRMGIKTGSSLSFVRDWFHSTPQQSFAFSYQVNTKILLLHDWFYARISTAELRSRVWNSFPPVSTSTIRTWWSLINRVLKMNSCCSPGTGPPVLAILKLPGWLCDTIQRYLQG